MDLTGTGCGEGNEAAQIVITGMGAVTPLGTDVDTFWDRLIAGECGIGPITSLDAETLAAMPVRIAAEVPPFDVAAIMGKKLARQTDRFSQFAYVAALQALADRRGLGGSVAGAGEVADAGAGASAGDAVAGDDDDAGAAGDDAGTGASADAAGADVTGAAAAADAPGRELPEPHRIGIVMSTAMGGIVPAVAGEDAYLRSESKHRRHGSPRYVPRTLANIPAAYLAIEQGITGPTVTVSTACASGNDALIIGASWLRAGECDAVVCMGSDSIVTPVVVESLARSGALSEAEGDPKAACRPFDRGRSGFVIGEGGAAVVLERADDARRCGAPIYGRIAGCAHNNDAHSIISPDPEGTLVKACMRAALDHAGIAPDQVGYINAHGTATEAGDAAEAAAIAEVFAGSRPWVSSTKGATGHMMAAGGIAEVIACVKTLATGSLPPNLNLDDPAFDLRFARPGDHASVDVALSNAFGFGGQNACIVVTPAYRPA